MAITKLPTSSRPINSFISQAEIIGMSINHQVYAVFILRQLENLSWRHTLEVNKLYKVMPQKEQILKYSCEKDIHGSWSQECVSRAFSTIVWKVKTNCNDCCQLIITSRYNRKGRHQKGQREGNTKAKRTQYNLNAQEYIVSRVRM